MADTVQSRRTEFFDDDPFAELTRIMGHDPRAAEEEAQAPLAAEEAAAGFDIDLEKELVGELDFADFDEPEAELEAGPVSDWREPAQAEATHGETARSEAAPVADDAAFAEDDRHSWPEAGAAEAPTAGEPAFESAPEPPFAADDFGDALERELFGPLDLPAAAPASLAPEPVAYEPEIREPAASEPAVAAHDDGESLSTGLDLDFLEEEIARDAAPVVPEAQTFDAPAAPEWDDEPLAEWDDEPADAEEAQPHQGDSFAYERASYRPVAEEPALSAQPQAEPDPLSLEDELSALLAEDAAPAASDDARQPAVDTFGRAGFAAPAVWQDEGAEDEGAEDGGVEDGIAAAPASASVQAAPAEEDFADIFGDDFALEIEEEAAAPAPQPAAAQPHAPDIETFEVVEAARPVADDLDIPDIDYGTPAPPLYDELEDEFAQAFGDLSAPEQPEPAAYVPGPAAMEAHYAAAATAYAPAPYAPVDDQWQAADPLSDDGFDYETDLEQAIAMSAFDDDVQDEPAPSRRRSLFVAALVGGIALVGGAGVLGMSLLGGGSDAPAIVRADADPMKVRPENPGGATVPNQDSQVYRQVGGAGQEPAPGQERLITTAEEPVDVTARTTADEAAALAPGVSEEGAQDEIAAADAAPKSEDRIDPAETAAADPVAEEIAAVAPRRVRTMIVRPDGTLVAREDPQLAAGEPAAIGQAVADEAATGLVEAATGLASPQEAAETALAAATTLAAPALAPANPLQAGQPDEAAALAEDEGGPLVETPATVGVVPTRRADTPAAAPAAQQPAARQAAAPRQQPAATPVSAPAAAAPAAAATSEWSMQIASQPTAEGAQATYQDLARRYGGVLEGRGVNIVRANIEGMGTYYRVRIPASNRDEAIQLCTRYKAAGGSCFVSR